jgi:hypothetical protein
VDLSDHQDTRFGQVLLASEAATCAPRTLLERDRKRLLGRRATRAESPGCCGAMSRAEREQPMYRGQLTLDQCCACAARRPAEVPVLQGEFWFLAITAADLLD